MAWQAGGCVPLVSAATAKELTQVLAYPKFKLSPEDREELLGDYLPYCEVVEIPRRLPCVPKCRDPLDLPFLHLALAGLAEALVTGDQDLLSLNRVGPCPIITPAVFLSSGSLPGPRQAN